LPDVDFVVADDAAELNCIAIALLLLLVLVHAVLKWLHHLLLAKYVMLLHSGSSWHDCLHRSRLAMLADDCPR